MKHFNKYKQLIDSNNIPACKELKLALKRIENFKSKYIFKQNEADKRISFIENECSNVKGNQTKLKLALPQKVWLETVFGFYKKEKIKKINPETMQSYETEEERRLINECPIVVSRGSGKTTLASAIGLMGMITDGEFGADIICLANTREQAAILLNCAKSMCNNNDSILSVLRENKILNNVAYGFEFKKNNSVFQVKTSRYDILDGLNSHFNIFDEVHGYTEDFIKVVNDGSSRKRKNWLSFYISTNGIKRDKVFDSYYKTWIDILNGDIKNDSIMPFIYKLDSVSEVKDPKMWFKSSPLLNITTNMETIKRDIELSRDNPIAQSEILAKTFNIPANSSYSYFTVKECESKKEFDINMFKGDPKNACHTILGIDLSDVGDICSISFMTVKDDKRYFLNKKYCPKKILNSMHRSDLQKYREWEEKGEIILHDSDYNDQNFIFKDLNNFMIQNNIIPIKVGYDKWNAREITKLFENYYGDICYCVEQKINLLSQYIKIFKEKIKTNKIIFNDPIASWCLMNVKVKINSNGDIYPNKTNPREKIDVFFSMLDAFVCYERNVEELEVYFN